MSIGSIILCILGGVFFGVGLSMMIVFFLLLISNSSGWVESDFNTFASTEMYYYK